MTRAGKAPAVQWYAGDALADEELSSMTLEEEGAYRRLLDHHWREGSIPADLEKLRRLCKWQPKRRFERIWAAIGGRFVPAPVAGRLINPRMDAQRQTLEQFRDLQSAKGKQSAAKRAEQAETGSNPVETRLLPESNSADCDLRSSSALNKDPVGQALALLPQETPKPKKLRKPKPPPALPGPMPFTIAQLCDAFKAHAKGRILVDPFDAGLAKPLTEVIRNLAAAGCTIADVELAAEFAGRDGLVWAKEPLPLAWLAKAGNVSGLIAKARAWRDEGKRRQGSPSSASPYRPLDELLKGQLMDVEPTGDVLARQREKRLEDLRRERERNGGGAT